MHAIHTLNKTHAYRKHKIKKLHAPHRRIIFLATEYTDRQTGKQTDRQTDRQKHILNKKHLYLNKYTVLL